jgi:predicted NAD/FAD-dependent oxidoreductase
MPLPQFLPVSKSIGSMDANLQSGSLFDDSGWVPCLALMLGLKSKPGYRSASDVADAGFIADGDGGEHWFCEQSERFYPAESELSSWVVHASSGFSKKYYQTNEKEVVDLLLQKLTTAGQPLHSFADSSLVVQKLHRWRFAKPVGKMTSDLQSLSGHGVFLAGDGLTGGRVEGAYLSGLDAAQKVLAFLQERTRR